MPRAPHCSLLALLATLLAACEGDSLPVDSGPPRDAAQDTLAGDTPLDSPAACPAGQLQCDSATDQARRCDGRGGFTETRDCRAMGMVCVASVGCVVCPPNATRCDPASPLTPQICAPDGSRWTTPATPPCNEAAGQTCRNGRCVDRCAELENTYLGCEYWPTVTPNSLLVPSFEFAVVVANPQTYPVMVTVEDGALPAPRTVTVAPGAVSTITLPWVSELSQNAGATCMLNGFSAASARRARGAYHLRANGPVAAYQFNPLTYRTASAFSYTNDASLLLPTNALGQHYVVVTTPTGSARNPDGSPATRGGFIALVGAQPEGAAQVTVRLTSPVWAPNARPTTLPAGEQRFTLDRGEVIVLLGSQEGADLTGSVVQSDKPIAVFTGHDCGTAPIGRSACDHLEEQLFPSATWGRAYAVSQFRDRGETETSVVRVVSQRAGNRLTFDGIPTPTGCDRVLDQGQFCEFETAGNFRVTGAQPILVMQLMHGLDAGPACMVTTCTAPPDRPECVGDPAMVFEVPIDQYRSSYNVLVPDTYVRSYLNVTVPDGQAVQLDGAALAGTPVPTGTGYRTYFIEVRPGAHTLRANDAAMGRFGVKIYGVASFTSYAYPGGLDLAPISPPG